MIQKLISIYLFVGQMKRAIKHFESVRRPSGNATTQEWEVLVTDLEKRVARLSNNNEELTKKNRKLAGDVERYSEAMLSVNGMFFTTHF